MFPQPNLSQSMDGHIGDSLIPRRIDEVAIPTRDSRFVLLKTRPLVSPIDNNSNTPADQTVAQQDKCSVLTIKSENQTAFGLLEDVKGFIPKILQENERLKQNLFELKSQAESEIETAEVRSREWKLSAESFKEQVETLEGMVLDLRSKLNRAESIVAIEKELSSKSGQEAAEAECLAKLFEDTVIQSFGVGTMFQDALARIEAANK